MARLPSEQFLMQQTGSEVVLFEDGTERELVRFDPADSMDAALALEFIRESGELGDEDKAFACFWAGYFHAHAGEEFAMARDPMVTEADDGTVFVMDGPAIVVSFDPRDPDASARAQGAVHASGLHQAAKDRAHFWCGFFYGRAKAGV